MATWSELSGGQQAFYMEFNAPIHNNIRRIPGNNEFLEQYTYTPSEIHINSVSDTGDRLVRTFNFALTNGQRNSIIQWLTESYGDDDWNEDEDW